MRLGQIRIIVTVTCGRNWLKPEETFLLGPCTIAPKLFLDGEITRTKLIVVVLCEIFDSHIYFTNSPEKILFRSQSGSFQINETNVVTKCKAIIYLITCEIQTTV